MEARGLWGGFSGLWWLGGGPAQSQLGVSLPGTHVQDFGTELARNICQPIQRRSMLFSASSKGSVFCVPLVSQRGDNISENLSSPHKPVQKLLNQREILNVTLK